MELTSNSKNHQYPNKAFPLFLEDMRKTKTEKIYLCLQWNCLIKTTGFIISIWMQIKCLDVSVHNAINNQKTDMPKYFMKVFQVHFT